jgi:hypothetical protein
MKIIKINHKILSKDNVPYKNLEFIFDNEEIKIVILWFEFDSNLERELKYNIYDKNMNLENNTEEKKRIDIFLKLTTIPTKDFRKNYEHIIFSFYNEGEYLL